MDHKQLIQTINAYLDGRLDADGIERLDRALQGSAKARRLYWKYAQIHRNMTDAWAACADQTQTLDFAEDAEASGWNEPIPFQRTHRKKRSHAKRIGALTGWAAGLAILCTLVGLAWYAEQRFGTVATLTGTTNAQWEAGGAPPADGELGRGKLRLLSGLAQIQFDQGASVTVEGPAEIWIEGDNRAFLKDGRLVAQVPERAHGFTVLTPNMKVVDLGTEFGVDATDIDGGEVHVFTGKVETGMRLRQGAEPAMRQLTEGRAVQVDAARGVAVSVPVAQARFARNLEQRRIRVHNTGVDGAGHADSHWRIIPIAEAGNATAGPAVRTALPGNYQRNSRSSAWISYDSRFRAHPKGHTAAFETTFDLTGLDAPSAQLEARVLADDTVIAYELNGVRYPLGAEFDFHSRHRGFRTVRIGRGFVGGKNTLRFIVRNAQAQFAFRAELDGTARALPTPTPATTP